MILKPDDYEAMATSEAARARAIVDGSPTKALVHATLAAAYASLASAAATTSVGRAELSGAT
jgi:hypothetical protein